MTFTKGGQITYAIKKCIRSEMKEDGILSDVETFIPSYRLEDAMDLPAVWLFEHPTTLVDNQRTLGPLIQVTTPFEFVCVEFDEDIEKAEILGKNLAWRVGKTILKNRDCLVNNKRVFNDITFNTLYPVGEVQIQGKLNRIPATSILFDVRYNVEWEEVPDEPSIKELVLCNVDTEVVAEELYWKDKYKKGGL